MGQKFLIDSNVVIDYTAHLLPDFGMQKITDILDEEFNISVIVKIEVLGYNDLPGKIELLTTFLDLATVFYLTDEVTMKTILLRRTNKRLKLGDAIIAATALVYDFNLVTRNTNDFKNMEGLTVVNPYEFLSA